MSTENPGIPAISAASSTLNPFPARDAGARALLVAARDVWGHADHNPGMVATSIATGLRHAGLTAAEARELASDLDAVAEELLEEQLAAIPTPTVDEYRRRRSYERFEAGYTGGVRAPIPAGQIELEPDDLVVELEGQATLEEVGVPMPKGVR